MRGRNQRATRHVCSEQPGSLSNPQDSSITLLQAKHSTPWPSISPEPAVGSDTAEPLLVHGAFRCLLLLHMPERAPLHLAVGSPSTRKIRRKEGRKHAVLQDTMRTDHRGVVGTSVQLFLRRAAITFLFWEGGEETKNSHHHWLFRGQHDVGS